MDTQKSIIDKNKTFSKDKDIDIRNQKSNIYNQGVELSTNKRNVIFSKSKREHINKQLIIQKYLFYTIICFIFVGTLYILISEITSRIIINTSENKLMRDSLNAFKNNSPGT